MTNEGTSYQEYVKNRNERINEYEINSEKVRKIKLILFLLGILFIILSFIIMPIELYFKGILLGIISILISFIIVSPNLFDYLYK